MAARRVPKIFLLNGSHDRETSACQAREGPMRASDCVTAVCNTLNRCESHGGALLHPVTSYVTALLVPENSSIEVDSQQLQAMGVRCILTYSECAVANISTVSSYSLVCWAGG